MNPLPFLVFILGLGSISCFDSWVDTTPEIKDQCVKQENVDTNNIRDWNDMRVKCFYHCVYEKKGVIVNGIYRGNARWCRRYDVADDNKCELAIKVIHCEMLRRGR